VPTVTPSKSANPILWALFGLKGRSSRQIYWLSYLLVVCLQSALGAQILEGRLIGDDQGGLHRVVAGGFGQLLLLSSLFPIFAVSVKRLHDIGHADFLGLAVAIPFVNVAFAIWLGVVPGSGRPNRYGDRPDIPV
jgi:uncharacterized membrane protein YhaH (DUF805 family)